MNMAPGGGHKDLSYLNEAFRWTDLPSILPTPLDRS